MKYIILTLIFCMTPSISFSSSSNFFDGIEEIKVEFACRQEVNEELSLNKKEIISYIENALIQSRLKTYSDKSSYSKFSKSGRPILSFYLEKVSTDGSPKIPIFVIKVELSLTVHPFNYKNEKAIKRAALSHYESYQIKKFDEKVFYRQIDNILFKFTVSLCKYMDCDEYYSPGKNVIPTNRKN